MKRSSVGSDLRMGASAARFGPLLLVAGAALLGVSMLVADDWTVFWKSWLVGWMSAAGIALAALWFTLLQHLTRAGWSVVVRRLAEGVARNLSWMWLLFVPVLLLVWSGQADLLYQWGDQELMHHDHLLQKKATYLSPAFWSARSIFYLATWAVIGTLYFKWSVAQDATGDHLWTHRMQRWAPICMILYAFTQTYAAVDWMMTLQPKWFSTMFGVYFWISSVGGFMAMLILLARWLQRTGHVRSAITVDHFHDMGKMLFAFGVVFWAYIGFSQYMLIWYANLPVETNWYMTRQLGDWTSISLLLLFGHFAVPFVVLVSRWPKRWRPTLPLIASWMLLMFFVDVYWLVMPVVPEAAIEAATSYGALAEAVAAGEVSVGFGFHLVNFTALAGMICLLGGGTLLNLRHCNLVPSADPRLDESLAFENI